MMSVTYFSTSKSILISLQYQYKIFVNLRWTIHEKNESLIGSTEV